MQHCGVTTLGPDGTAKLVKENRCAIYTDSKRAQLLLVFIVRNRRKSSTPTREVLKFFERRWGSAPSISKTQAFCALFCFYIC